jgi:tetratricopeptide (TPR) repeat protein
MNIATTTDPMAEFMLKGDMLHGQSRWEEALRTYQKALALTYQGTSEWGQLLVERLARAHIVMGEYDAAEDLLDEVEEQYIEHVTAAGEHPDPLVVALCQEKRGWIARYRGHEAAPYFERALVLAQQLGLNSFAATCQHMVGRVLAETHGIRAFYPEVFPDLRRDQRHLTYALQQVQMAQEKDKDSDEASVFGQRWQGNLLLLLGQHHDGMECLRESIQLYGESAPGDYAWRDRVRAEALDATYREEHNDLRDQLDDIFYRSVHKKHPYAIAEALATRLYLESLAHTYRFDRTTRQKMADLAVLTMLLHPYPAHPFYQVAEATLHRSFLPAMDERERRSYLVELPRRVGVGEGSFAHVKSLGLSSDLALLTVSLVQRQLGDGEDRPDNLV